MNQMFTPTEAALAPVLSYSPVVLLAPGRGTDLELRVSAPAIGGDLPILVFSHGNGQSMRAYGPLVDHWAAQGYAVIQPTDLRLPDAQGRP